MTQASRTGLAAVALLLGSSSYAASKADRASMDSVDVYAVLAGTQLKAYVFSPENPRGGNRWVVRQVGG